MKKFGIVLPPILALILETLPFGAVCVFAPSPTERVRQTFSYFSLTPFGYANFAPFLTALATCVMLLLAIEVFIKKSGKIMRTLFAVSVTAAILSLTPLLYGLEYYSICGGFITAALVLEAVLSGLLMRKSSSGLSNASQSGRQ